MATVEKIKIIVEAEDKATAPISKATEATQKLGKESKKVTKESKKDWGGLGDLFSQVLPRGLQSVSRGFKGTQRQVGRLSKSFKVLKAAWASIGIGLIIIALEEVIARWDDISEALGFHNAEAATTAKVNKAGADAVFELTAETRGYYKVLKDNSGTDKKSSDQRALALQKLTGLVGDYVDKEADAATQQKQVLEIMEAREKLAKAQAKTQQRIALNEEALQKTTKAYALENKGYLEDWWSFQTAQKVEQIKTRKAAEEATKESIDAEVEYLALLAIATDREKGRADAIKDDAQIKREAEANRKKILQQQAADEKWLANQRITIAQQTELRLIQDDEQRQLRSLEIQHETAKEELKARGGTLTDKLLLEQNYLMDKEEITNGFKERADEKTAEEEEKLKQDTATLKAALATDQENEILQVQDRYAKLQELAIKDSEESKQLTEKSRQEIDAINKKFNDKEIAENDKVQSLKMQAVGKMVNSVSGLLGNLSDLAEENSEQQKRLAIVDILINQSVAMANAIAGAAKAAKDTGPGAPFTFVAYVATMLGTIAGSFASIKAVMNEAGASGGGSIGGGSRGGGGGGIQPTLPLPARLDSPSNANQAYVVQSQLQGQQMSQNRLNGQIIL